MRKNAFSLVIFGWWFLVVLLWGGASVFAEKSPESAVADVVKLSGTTGGLVIHVGSGDGRLTAALRVSDGFMVHGLDASAENVAKAREFIASKDLYGPVSVDRLSGRGLPYVEGIAALVVVDDASLVDSSEVMRVLRPGGIAVARQGEGWAATRKSVPADIDEWTHYFHGPDGNAVANDTEVGPPRHLQWVGSPRWSRHHDRMASMSALVTAGARIFYIMDEGSRMSIEMPAKWALIARDAFSGVVLWKRPMADWHNHLWPLKSGPTQLTRRLITDGKTVYVTLAFKAPLEALDAATGKTIRTYEGTKACEEVVLDGGVLYAMVNSGASELDSYAPQMSVGDQKRVAKEYEWDGKPRVLAAIEAATGRKLWSIETKIAPLNLAVVGGGLFFYDGERLRCLDAKTGKEKWAGEPAGRRPSITFNYGPRLVAHKGVVLFSGGDRKMAGYAANDGKKLWEAEHPPSGYVSPQDLLVVDDLVWCAPTTSGKDTGVFKGRNPLTGEVVSEFPPDVETYWFHHRCHPGKATSKYLLMSRTGIEFVDYKTKDWLIHHWVRGGCLYGVMPANGLLYAPPHNCACYPETKLFGFNALAAESPSRALPKTLSEDGRFEKGPAFSEISDAKSQIQDWPTYRGDNLRSGRQAGEVPAKLGTLWATELGGRVTSPTVAAGTVFVAQPDSHRVVALDAATGKPRWAFTAGGPVDSPPTWHAGRVLFGSADGWVYSLRAADGALAWRYRGAPMDRRLAAFENVESVWPIHGNILVEDGVACFVAGRSIFLDGGIRLIRLDAATGKKLGEVVLNDRDPEDGGDLQDRIQVLNMPAGLSDILCSDGKRLYMRSQQFSLDGKRLELGPHSGEPAKQGSVQRGEGEHLFAPNGFTDESWFHRMYWVYGRSFAGGHGGYYQAGKYAPAGRILVHDDQRVYGFGRKPEYYRWTTPLEHQLFATDIHPPEVKTDEPAGKGKAAAKSSAPMIRVAKSPGLDPTGKAITVEAWVKATGRDGVILAHGGPQLGYSLFLEGGYPNFCVRSDKAKASTVAGDEPLGREWAHVAGVLAADGKLGLFVNGEMVGASKGVGTLPKAPSQGMEIGGDDAGAVGDYKTPFSFHGIIDELRVYHAALGGDDIARSAKEPAAKVRADALVLAYSFDDGAARDASGKGHDAEIAGVTFGEGRSGKGAEFEGSVSGSGAAGAAGHHVQFHWTRDVPLLVRAMAMAGDALFIAGPPDLVNEEEALEKLAAKDAGIQKLLARQDAALEGAEGMLLWAISAKDGATLAEHHLDGVPAWDGMAAANGKLFLVTADGKVVCLGPGGKMQAGR